MGSLLPTTLYSGGCTSMCHDDDGMSTLGSILTSTATGMSSGSSNGGLSIDVHAAEIEQSKAYVQSLSVEEQDKLLDLLTEKEQMIKDTGTPYVKKYNK